MASWKLGSWRPGHHGGGTTRQKRWTESCTTFRRTHVECRCPNTPSPIFFSKLAAIVCLGNPRPPKTFSKHLSVWSAHDSYLYMLTKAPTLRRMGVVTTSSFRTGSQIPLPPTSVHLKALTLRCLCPVKATGNLCWNGWVAWMAEVDGWKTPNPSGSSRPWALHCYPVALIVQLLGIFLCLFKSCLVSGFSGLYVQQHGRPRGLRPMH